MRKFRIILLSGMLLLGIGGMASLPANPAHASTRELVGNRDPIQVCNSTPKCLNAWFGGPNVKDYNAGVTNDAFEVFFVNGVCNSGHTTTTNCPISGVPSGLNIEEVAYTNVSGDVVGDLNNSQTNAQAGLSNGTPWGYIFVEDDSICQSGYFALANSHWSGSWSNPGFLGYSGSGNGNQFYLNTNVMCFNQTTF